MLHVKWRHPICASPSVDTRADGVFGEPSGGGRLRHDPTL